MIGLTMSRCVFTNEYFDYGSALELSNYPKIAAVNYLVVIIKYFQLNVSHFLSAIFYNVVRLTDGFKVN